MNKYKIVYADVPHEYQNWSDSKNGAAKSAYDTMNTKDLCELPIDKITDKDSLCFFWATFPRLKESIEILEAWGFKYITTPFVWNKTYDNGKPYCGLGFWTRNGAEIVLLGKKGKGVKRLKSATAIRQVVTEPMKRPHSTKPPIIRDRIIELVGDHPKIELFGRHKVDGWTVLGNEVSGKDIREDLANIINS